MRILEAWEGFENGELRYFDVHEQETLRHLWNTYLANIEKDGTELRYLRRTLQQRIEMFDAMRNGASAIPKSMFGVFLTDLASECFIDG